MSSLNRPAFLAAAPDLPTDRDYDRLRTALWDTAQEKGFSTDLTNRYEAWIFVFVAWCLRTPPHDIDAARLDAFWRALHNHPDVSAVELAEAMDAVAFLFGALGGVDEYFRYGADDESSGPAPVPHAPVQERESAPPKREAAPVRSDDGPAVLSTAASTGEQPTGTFPGFESMMAGPA
jgi:hypothetical protein